MQAQVDIKSVWSKVVDRIKMKIIHPTLWRSIEVAVPITIDDGQFVVGFPPGTYHMSGNLTSSDHKNAIEMALREFGGMALSLRIIEGSTVEDWKSVKAKDANIRALKDAEYRKAEAEAAVAKSWEGLLESVGRKYANTPMRQLPQFRAQYIQDVLQDISDTMDVLMPEGKPREELAERSLARVLEKVGTLIQAPAALIAYELRRYRGK